MNKLGKADLSLDTKSEIQAFLLLRVIEAETNIQVAQVKLDSAIKEAKEAKKKLEVAEYIYCEAFGEVPDTFLKRDQITKQVGRRLTEAMNKGNYAD
jgi:hypothetical protein